jgi:hypothetical protein
MDSFQKNIQLWAKTAPRQALMLPYVACEHLSFCRSRSGELNLCTQVNGKKSYVHSSRGPALEAEHWFQTLPLRNVSLLCVYGVGLGYYYDAALAWLKKERKRRLVFLEDDLSMIHRLFETEKASQILQDPQVQLLYFKDFKEEEAAFEQLYWSYAFTPLSVSALRSYQKEKQALFDQLEHKISYDAAMKNALVDEYMRYGVSFYMNFYQNMLLLPDAYLGTRLFNRFQDVPAIICGAGPSLAKHFRQLPGLMSKALLFAGGSSMNALNQAGILPHFGVGIDPNPAQLERLSSNQAQEVPFFYRNRIHHEGLKTVQGPRLYITGTGGYDTAEYFEQQLGIAYGSFIDEGHNVINFCTQLAQAMGCNPILYVGMDLAFTGMHAYAPGIQQDVKVAKAQLTGHLDPDQNALLRKDIYGRDTYTLWKWIAESNWLGDFAAAHPQLTMLNCTEGGIGFPGVHNCTLKYAAAKYLTRQYELKSRIRAEIQNSAMPQVTLKKISAGMRALEKSLWRCESHLQILIDEIEAAKKKIQEGQREWIQSGRSVLAETDLAEEPGFKYVLDVFNEVYTRLLSGELHEANLKTGAFKRRQMKRFQLSQRAYRFLLDVARVNRGLIEYAFKNRAKKKDAAPPQLTEPSALPLL